VLRLAPLAGYASEEGWYTLADLATADEAFTSSSIRELMPIVRLDDRSIGDGRPGPAATSLLAALREAAGA
jgi:branched-subunit amino acid aminotransferase/4-amino-4-deoxychorismate lyase